MRLRAKMPNSPPPRERIAAAEPPKTLEREDAHAPKALRTSRTGAMTIEEGGHFSKDNELGKRSDSTFTFSNCRYVIKEKEILKGLSGTVKSGEVLAIVGPSGAGKTMLMNMFSLTPGPGKRREG